MSKPKKDMTQARCPVCKGLHPLMPDAEFDAIVAAHNEASRVLQEQIATFSRGLKVPDGMAQVPITYPATMTDGINNALRAHAATVNNTEVFSANAHHRMHR